MGVVGRPFTLGRADIARLGRFLPRRVTRRAVIGGALVVGGAVTALRLLGLERGIPRVKPRAAAAPAAPAKTVDWTSPLALETARITHLLRRTTFGAGPDELDAA